MLREGSRETFFDVDGIYVRVKFCWKNLHFRIFVWHVRFDGYFM